MGGHDVLIGGPCDWFVTTVVGVLAEGLWVSVIAESEGWSTLREVGVGIDLSYTTSTT